MNRQKIINIIQEIKAKLNLVEIELDEIESGSSLAPGIQIISKEQNELEKLKSLLESPEWPEAVSKFQVVDMNSEEEKMDRAEGILDILIQEDLKNKKFLDFGCGEGHMAKYGSKQESSFSVGYDIVKSDKSKFNWEIEEEKCILTTDFEKVKEKGPYDVIMIYDVIDHAENPEDILSKAKSILSNDGKIYLRCHPWCGRHGGHYYRQINKAFVHLVFTEEELNNMEYVLEERNNKILFPIIHYNNLFKKVQLIKESEDIESQTYEDFFNKNQIVADRIIALFGMDKFPKFQIEQCFHDYVLRK